MRTREALAAAGAGVARWRLSFEASTGLRVVVVDAALRVLVVPAITVALAGLGTAAEEIVGVSVNVVVAAVAGLVIGIAAIDF
jgi:hypothetical protein